MSRRGLSVAVPAPTTGDTDDRDDPDARSEIRDPLPAGIAPPSYILTNAHFVKDDVAVFTDGVAMKGAGRTFVVQPESLVLGEVVGRGASSYVQRAIHGPTGTLLALKVINVFDRAKRGQLIREIQALYDSDCDALVTFMGAFYRDGAITIVLENMDLGPLSAVVSRAGRLPEPALASVAFQVLWALAYLRVEKRLHRDLKPSNILVNSRGQVKLSDFGISAELKNSIGLAATFVGTAMYMSPERIQHRPYSFPADVWSLGLVLVEAATGRYPYPVADTYIEMAEEIVGSPEPLVDPRTTGLSPEFAQFVASCLHKNPDDRLPADILLGSPWLSRHGVVSIDAAVSVMHSCLAVPQTAAVVGRAPAGSAAQRSPAERHDEPDVDMSVHVELI